METPNILARETSQEYTRTEGNVEVKDIRAYGTKAFDAPLNRLNINRRKPTPHDVEIEILYCGVCHSDLHTVRNEWHGTIYPCVPGHEIVGRIVSVGNHVSKFKVGDFAAVGCMVDSCRECEYCKQGLEQYCEPGNTLTYNSPDKYLNTRTYGGYSESIVVDEDCFVVTDCVKSLFQPARSQGKCFVSRKYERLAVRNLVVLSRFDDSRIS